MDTNVSLKDTANEAFEQYAGAVLQSRALVDARDCVKPSTRQILYAMHLDNLTYDKPFKKTLKAISSSMRYYIHGDASVEGIVMHCAQPFFMRYPLVEVEGSYGTQIDTESWAAPRYTSSRLSKVADTLLGDTNENTIEEWEDNYDDTDKYPRILSSLGFYNIVNGSFGIGLGMASSIPQFNLNEVNEALITLLENPDCSFDDILCYPDFCTGGTIINKDEIVDSLRDGQGKACVVRATIDYDKGDNCLIVRDLPYGVYSNTICTEVEKMVEKNPDCGISNVNDLTGESVCIKIYLRRKNIQDRVKASLYDNTSLQKSISINMTMLEDGRFPKVFGWREALTAHLEHERKTYVNYYNYELGNLNDRLDVVNGFLYVIGNTEKVIDIIKTSDDVKADLAGTCDLKANQIKAILDMRLARLSHLDDDKYHTEKTSLEERIKDVEDILGSDERLKEVMVERFREVEKEFGDERRTKLTNLEVKKVTRARTERVPEDVVIEVVRMPSTPDVAYLKRIPATEYKPTAHYHFRTKTDELVWLFTDAGKLYKVMAGDVKECSNADRGQAVRTLKAKLADDEHVILVLPNKDDDVKPYVMFAFENGKCLKMAKGNLVGPVRNLRGKQLVTGKLCSGGIHETNGDVVRLTTNDGYVLDFEASKLKVSKSGTGRRAIRLHDGDHVASMAIVTDRSNVQNLGVYGRR